MIPAAVAAIVFMFVAPVFGVAWWHRRNGSHLDALSSFIPNEFWVYRIPAGVLSTEDIGSEFQMAGEGPWDWRYAMPVKAVHHLHRQVSITTGEASVTVSADNELYLRPLAPVRRAPMVRYVR